VREFKSEATAVEASIPATATIQTPSRYLIALTRGFRMHCRAGAHGDARSFDQMQNAREQRMSLGRATYVNDRGVLEFIGEHVDEDLENIVLQQTESAVPPRPTAEPAAEFWRLRGTAVRPDSTLDPNDALHRAAVPGVQDPACTGRA